MRARSSRRLSVLLALYLLLTGGIAWRLVSVQVVSAQEYRDLAQRQTLRDYELPARRGRLYDRMGDPLAMSLPASTVYADPRVLQEDAVVRAGITPESVAAELAPVMGMEEEGLADRLRADTHFVYLGRQLPRGVGQAVAAMTLPGVGVLEEPARTYPAGGLAAQVIGFVGIDNTGLAGLEHQHDSVLAGQAGRARSERAPGGLMIGAAPIEIEPAAPGADLVLTIDRHIQFAAEDALTRAVKQFDAKGASAIVIDVATGEVLAMASAPSFEPDEISGSDDYARRNRAVTDVYEPGSVNKVITIAAALEEGLVTPDEVFRVPDRFQVGSKTFRDTHSHPETDMSVSEIMSQSSNIGTIQIADQLGEEALYEYVQRFGYGSKTGLGFPGESAGLLPDVSNWSATSLPTIAIGHGVSATLLQVAEVFQTIAADGQWVQPTLLRGSVGADGRIRPAESPRRQRVVSPGTAEAVADMLVGVVESGTGGQAAVAGYNVGGKTGTARKPSQTGPGYVEGAYISSFAGFAPAENPAVVVAVMVDEPKRGYYAGSTAGPLFSEIMGFTLSHRRVAPSEPEGQASADPAAGEMTRGPAG
ncbi:MAG TPA: penicillin-binding protein 2 [Egibacteraceae bacterium]|nr:penicillin-binding protein 2 [Egibacteraceae bacterium]